MLGNGARSILTLALFLGGFGSLHAAEPAKEQVHVKVEDLIDNVADLQVRRFTIITSKDSSFKLNLGEASFSTKGTRVDDGKYRLEVIVLVRLIPDLRLDTDPKEAKIRCLVKLSREVGGYIEEEYDVPLPKSLVNDVKIDVMSGLYPMEKPIALGAVCGNRLVITVD